MSGLLTPEGVALDTPVDRAADDATAPAAVPATPASGRLADLYRRLGHRGRAVLTVVGLALLLLVSLWLRTRRMDVGFWIDEGISVGIVDRPLADIPGILRLDGSPPLFYLLLHGWVRLFGTGDAATHAFSVTLALLVVPVTFVGTRGILDTRGRWYAAALAATNPFLTQYAQETRMYALVVLIGMVAVLAFVHLFVHGRRRALPVLALSVSALVYTHNWAAFLAAAAGLAWLGLLRGADRDRRRAMIRDAAIVVAAVVVLYLPWLSSSLFQLKHTGAPWAGRPELDHLLTAPSRLLGPQALIVLIVAAGLGLVRATRDGARNGSTLGRTGACLLVMGLGSIVLAWVASQITPAWAIRYMAVAVPPLVLVAAVGLSRAGTIGVLGLVMTLGLWLTALGPEEKSNVRSLATAAAPSLRPGDLVISTQPEQVPVLHHYLPTGLRYATLWGSIDDVGVTDWRDGVARLSRTSAERNLRPLFDRLPVGAHVLLVQPTIGSTAGWSAPWTSLVRLRSQEWVRAARNDPRFRVTAIYPKHPTSHRPNPLDATVLTKLSSPPNP